MEGSWCWSDGPPSPEADQFRRKTAQCELRLGRMAHAGCFDALMLTIIGCVVIVQCTVACENVDDLTQLAQSLMENCVWRLLDAD
jgi:hypothetical protein